MVDVHCFTCQETYCYYFAINGGRRVRGQREGYTHLFLGIERRRFTEYTHFVGTRDVTQLCLISAYGAVHSLNRFLARRRRVAKERGSDVAAAFGKLLFFALITLA